MVSAILDVPADDLRQSSVWGRICIYQWDGGEARLTMASVREDAEAAATSFGQSYRTLSPEEAAEAAGAVSAALDRRVAHGQLDAEHAEPASAVGGMLAGIAASQQLESVEGIGERAVYDGTVRTMTMPSIGEINHLMALH